MEEIEFQMHPTRSDFSKAASAKLKFCRPFHIYLIVVGIILLGCIIWYNYGPEFGHSVATGVGLLAFLGLIGPFIVVARISRDAFKSYSPRIEEFTNRVNEQGIGWKCPSMEVYLSWEHVKAIYETKEFLLVRLKQGSFFTIFKNRIPADVVVRILNVMRGAPVQNKKMFPDG